MSIYDFELTNGSGFYGEAGKYITVRAGAMAASWNGGIDMLSDIAGTIGFGTRSIKLQTAGGKDICEIVLREPRDTFDTVPLNTYISGAIIHSPKAGVSASGWRWRMIGRVV
jgi:hypothetical protein